MGRASLLRFAILFLSLTACKSGGRASGQPAVVEAPQISPAMEQDLRPPMGGTPLSQQGRPILFETGRGVPWNLPQPELLRGLFQCGLQADFSSGCLPVGTVVPLSDSRNLEIVRRVDRFHPHLAFFLQPEPVHVELKTDWGYHRRVETYRLVYLGVENDTIVERASFFVRFESSSRYGELPPDPKATYLRVANAEGVTQSGYAVPTAFDPSVDETRFEKSHLFELEKRSFETVHREILAGPNGSHRVAASLYALTRLYDSAPDAVDRFRSLTSSMVQVLRNNQNYSMADGWLNPNCLDEFYNAFLTLKTSECLGVLSELKHGEAYIDIITDLALKAEIVPLYRHALDIQAARLTPREFLDRYRKQLFVRTIQHKFQPGDFRPAASDTAFRLFDRMAPHMNDQDRAELARVVESDRDEAARVLVSGISLPRFCPSLSGPSAVAFIEASPYLLEQLEKGELLKVSPWSLGTSGGGESCPKQAWSTIGQRFFSRFVAEKRFAALVGIMASGVGRDLDEPSIQLLLAEISRLSAQDERVRERDEARMGYEARLFDVSGDWSEERLSRVLAAALDNPSLFTLEFGEPRADWTFARQLVQERGWSQFPTASARESSFVAWWFFRESELDGRQRNELSQLSGQRFSLPQYRLIDVLLFQLLRSKTFAVRTSLDDILSRLGDPYEAKVIMSLLVAGIWAESAGPSPAAGAGRPDVLARRWRELAQDRRIQRLVSDPRANVRKVAEALLSVAARASTP